MARKLQQLIKISLLLFVLSFSFAAAAQHGASAAVDPECDPNSSEYVGAEDAEYFCEDEEQDVDGAEAEVEDEGETETETETTPTPAATAAPAPTTEAECTNMKECNVPETGPGEVLISLLGVSVLGYGLRKWFASRHARQEMLEGLYRKG